MANDQDYLADGFRDVDSQRDIDKFKTCLAFMDSLPSFQRYKEETDRHLGLSTGSNFIDVGCGLGFDVERIARKTSGIVFGLDASEELIGEAQNRANAEQLHNIRYVVQDAHKMNFDDETFDGTRVDRVLQHVEDPSKVINEMTRVTRKGGKVVCAEPDWRSFIIDDDLHYTNTISTEWTGRFRNPFAGRQLARIMSYSGLVDIKICGHLLVTYGLKEVNLVFDVLSTCKILDAKNQTDEFSSWYKRILQRDADIPIFAGVTIVLAAGLKR